MKEESRIFDFKAFEEEAIQQLRSGKRLEGADGVLAPLIKRLVEASLEGELEDHLQESSSTNKRSLYVLLTR